jgi:hypothetical protein
MTAVRKRSIGRRLGWALCLPWLGLLLAHPSAGRAADGVFNADEKRALLADHNERRAQLARGRVSGQPPASDMNELFWDDGLAELAHAWVKRCEWRHNPQRKQQLDPARTRFRFEAEHTGVGENLYSSTDLVATLSLFVKGHDNWWGEHRQYRNADGACSGVCGHYTQMAWAATRYVGCAYAVCPDLAGQGRSQTYYACNYFPAGNASGQRPYSVGEGCGGCESDRRSCREGLCAGCMAPAHARCSDFASNCADLAASCPGNCSLESDQSLCSSCRATCESCPDTFLQPETRCDAVPAD